MKPLLLAALSVLLAVTAPDTIRAQDDIIAITGVGVLHPEQARIESDQTVLVQGDVITRVGAANAVEVPESARVIDGAGRYLVPGLAEMHAHIPGDELGRQYVEDVLFLFVANGVTTIRGMLGRPDHLLLKEQVATGEVTGPRIYTSGPSFNSNSVSSPRQAAAMVRAQKAAGYDFLKQHPGLTAEEFRAMAESARAVGVPFAGHISRDAGLEAVMRAGQATVDHLEGYLEALVPPDQRVGTEPGFFGLGLVDRVDEARLPDLARLTVDTGTAVVPTETLMLNLAGPGDADELAARPEMRYVPRDMLSDWREAKSGFAARSGASPEQMARFLELRRELLKAMHEAGVPILLGADAPQIFNVPGFAVHRELSAYVDAGLSPAQALATGTANPARFFRAQDWFGRIAPGLSADLILAAGNPLEDISQLARPDGVMLRGRWLDRAELDRGLAAIAARHDGPADD